MLMIEQRFDRHSLDEGAQFSNLTMTLYKVKNGNMKTYRLSEAEF